MAQLLEALKILKDKKVVHRDIKPENVCVQENGNLVLMDFELAIIEEESNGYRVKDDILVGTTLYIAPETYQCLEYSDKTDLWAVAILACELHSPKLPWKLNERMPADAVGRTIIKNKPTRPLDMSDALWGFLCKIFVPKVDRITVEEAMEDPLFSSFTFTQTTSDGKKLPGNVFDRHACLDPVRRICAERGHLSANNTSSLRSRFLDVQEKSSSPLIETERTIYVSSLSPKMATST